MRLILTRHHKTESNARERVLGWSDSPPVASWQEDIGFISKCLREQGIQPAAIYCSDLQRAQRTAQAYADSFAINEVVADPSLREVNYGTLQGQEKGWVYENFSEHKINPDFVYPEGESFRQMQDRSVKLISSLLRERPDGTVLIVSHAGVIRGIASYFLGLEYSSNLKNSIPFRYIGDFRFDDEVCTQYQELGEASGFVQAGAE